MVGSARAGRRARFLAITGMSSIGFAVHARRAYGGISAYSARLARWMWLGGCGWVNVASGGGAEVWRC
jgi:hypothetical protein